mgnify:CR=1 FL=1
MVKRREKFVKGWGVIPENGGKFVKDTEAIRKQKEKYTQNDAAATE